MKKFAVLLVLFGLVFCFQPSWAQTTGPEEPPTAPVIIPSAYDPTVQTAQLFAYEMEVVYRVNLERQASGNLPPMRMNREMTLASRWFSWDSVENRPYSWIGHTDTEGNSPGVRVYNYGYRGTAGWENALWASYLINPAGAFTAWKNSSGHYANMLVSSHTETGVGYYHRASDDITYAVQNFGYDSLYPPVIVNREALNTTSQTVELYQYSPVGDGGMTSMGQATDLMISNNACFSGASWRGSYQSTISNWSVTSGNGWKTVYSKIRDHLGRTSSASDTIYYGASVPTNELSLSMLSQTRSSVTFYGLNSGGMPSMQFSPGWIADDSHPNFTLFNGDKTPATADAAAIGGTTFRMTPGGNDWAWVWAYNEFPSNANYVAYFRLKTNSLPSSPVVNVSVYPGSAADVTRTINGTEFTTTGQYQEFAVPFYYTTSTDDPFLIFDFTLAGSATVDVDAVTIFTASVPFSSTYTWSAPGAHYRGQGVWVRYVNGSIFTSYQDAQTNVPLTVTPSQVFLLGEPNQDSRAGILKLTLPCGGSWSQQSKPSWLQVTPTDDGNTLVLTGNAASSTSGSLILQSGGYSVTIPVTLTVVDQISDAYLPIIRR